MIAQHVAARVRPSSVHLRGQTKGAPESLNRWSVSRILLVIGVALSAVVLGPRGLPQMWRWISWTAAFLLILSIVLHEVSDTPAGDLIAAVASGLLLPAWALILASRSDRLDRLPG